MTDYIKREDAYQAVADNNYSDSITLARYDAILKSIGNIPPADVRENVHAHWIQHEDDWYGDYWECSACHDEYIVNEGAMYYKHCPTCGAVMDGVRK